MENHHIIPISLGGPDKFSNTQMMQAKQHREELHATLDIPSRQYQQYTRKIKIASNDKLVVGPDAIQMMGDIQKEFFKNIYKLPRWMQLFHIEKLGCLAQEERDRYCKMLNDKFDLPLLKKNDAEQIHAIHDNYIACRKEMAKEIQNFLKTEYHKPKLSG